VADANQYLRLSIRGTQFLLPASMRYAIEQRDQLEVSREPGSRVAAWRSTGSIRAPAYSLDANLVPVLREDWQRAVYLEQGDRAWGIVVDDVHMLPRGETAVVPFTPLGPAPTRDGPLFNGAWVAGRRATLVFEPRALMSYLDSLGD
jgi:hypothetical protein